MVPDTIGIDNLRGTLIIGVENIFGPAGSSAYLRYREFLAAPGLLPAALNLPPVSKFSERKPLLWLEMLSGAHYYVHNNMMEDYLILKNVPGINISFPSGIVFLLGLLSVIPFAVIWQ